MSVKPVFKILLFSSIIILIFLTPAVCQNKFESSLKSKMDSLAQEPGVFARDELYPNDAMQNLMTPSGWGGYGTYVFGGIGGTYPAVYTNRPDLIGSVGFCVGNSAKAINLATSLNITKVTSFSDLSVNFIASRKLFRGTSVSIGGLQLFAPVSQSDAPGSTFYIAFSQAIQGVFSKTPGSSAITYTIGYGTGRFLLKSPYDVIAGKGHSGTGVFGSVSCEVVKHVNLNAEWTGLNLGLSVGIRPFKTPFSLGVGVSDLTNYTSDKPAMIFSMGYPLSLNRAARQKI